MKRKYYLVIDTETASLTGEIYDIGWTICDRRGRIYRQRSFCVKEVLHNPALMMGAYYAKKIFSWYMPRLESGEIFSRTWREIVETLRADMSEFEVSGLAAYNLQFDMRAMRQMQRKYSDDSKILPFRVDLLCLWYACCKLRLNTRGYKSTARKFGWLSDAGNIRTTAEHAYRFCKQAWEFIESHTALNDAVIETDLLAWCFSRRKGLPWNTLNRQPWKIVNA